MSYIKLYMFPLKYRLVGSNIGKLVTLNRFINIGLDQNMLLVGMFGRTLLCLFDCLFVFLLACLFSCLLACLLACLLGCLFV